jgi:hypothetical protein
MSTTKDSAIDRVREVRHKISAQFGHDTRRLIDHYIEKQKKYADRFEKSAPESKPAEVVTK